MDFSWKGVWAELFSDRNHEHAIAEVCCAQCKNLEDELGPFKGGRLQVQQV